ncbi:hypothetical protein A2Y99_01870 [Candidatus Gottesmanbacteria bacterium RBG_13_37_7]|uniref:Transcription factor zinc-finger domain-containing protein n=1 Tax=Candidatus Gottesmanbacteria bacterium RBG_13_37_7 TaxID=1798369 RepID=A0A1F5YL39_9BACT|nr:MAG: hypothetical protein A2Y99_01870 [Candidatus Gottesmanbacteria bacterium RBG_13_37_7]
MLCPSCSNNLQKFSVTTNSGGRFEVDHCGSCGGTWFDPYEINRIPLHEVARVAKETVLFHVTNEEKTQKKCPRCHKILYLYHFQSTPKGIIFLRCKTCLGIFATQKSLEEYKKYQKEIITDIKRKGLAFPTLSMVFIPAFFVLLLLASTFITVRNLQEKKDLSIKASENVTNLSIIKTSTTSITISFNTKIPVLSILRYGESTFDFREKVISGDFSTFHQTEITDLEKSSPYILQFIFEDSTGIIYTSEVIPVN